jgi:hypothetical protein
MDNLSVLLEYKPRTAAKDGGCHRKAKGQLIRHNSAASLVDVALRIRFAEMHSILNIPFGMKRSVA